jgi:hypothetical protein
MFLSENGNPSCNPGLQEIQVEAEKIRKKLSAKNYIGNFRKKEAFVTC